MRKFIVLFCLFFITIAYAEMPTIIGEGAWSNKAYRDNIYDWLVAHSTNAIREVNIIAEDWDVNTDTPTYRIKIYINYPISKIGDRNAIKTKIINIRADVRTLFLHIGIYNSHNDNDPGLCQPDIINTWITK